MIRTICLVSMAALSLAACGPTEPAPAPATPAASTGTDSPAAEIQKQQLDAAAALGAAAGGAGNPQMAAFTSGLNKVADVIVTVKDEASARTLGERLAPVYAEMQKASKDFEALPEDQKRAAAMASATQIVGPAAKIGTHLMSLSPELQKIVEDELDKMPDPPT